MIQHATFDDLPELLELGQAFHSESPYGNAFPYDVTSMDSTLRGLMANPDACVLVAKHGDQIIGGLLGLIQPMYMNHAVKAAVELAWFVTPLWRGSSHALKLLYYFEEWAADHGAKLTVMSALSSLPSVSRLYTRLGYAPCESSYVKGIPWPLSPPLPPSSAPSPQ